MTDELDLVNLTVTDEEFEKEMEARRQRARETIRAILESPEVKKQLADYRKKHCLS